MSQKRSSLKKWLTAAAKLLVVVVIFWFVRQTIYSALDKLGEHPLRLDPLWLIAAAAIYLVGLLPAGLFWHRVLQTLGQDAQLGETLRAYYIGHLGKYVPGKAMVVVLRAGLIRSRRVDTGVAAVSVFFETLTMMSVGALIAAAVLAVLFRGQTLLCLLAVGLMIAAGLPTIPPVFRRLVQLAQVGRSDPATAEKIQKLGYGTLLMGFVAMAIVWVMLGGSFWAVLRGMGVSDLDLLGQMPLYVASVSLAMVAGFLSLIPGGAGVRELVLTELTFPHFGEVVALVSAILLRLVWLAAELAISGVLWAMGPRKADVPGSEKR